MNWIEWSRVGKKNMLNTIIARLWLFIHLFICYLCQFCIIWGESKKKISPQFRRSTWIWKFMRKICVFVSCQIKADTIESNIKITCIKRWISMEKNIIFPQTLKYLAICLGVRRASNSIEIIYSGAVSVILFTFLISLHRFPCIIKYCNYLPSAFMTHQHPHPHINISTTTAALLFLNRNAQPWAEVIRWRYRKQNN